MLEFFAKLLTAIACGVLLSDALSGHWLALASLGGIGFFWVATRRAD